MHPLDIITDGMDDKEFKKSVKDNFKFLSAAFLQTDLRLVGSYSTTTNTDSTTSATMTRIEGLGSGFETNGGLVVVLAVISVMNETNRTELTMLIDSAVVQYATAPPTPAGLGVPFMWVGTLSAGKHSLDFQWLTTGGTSTLVQDIATTYYYILEFLKG